MKTSLFLITKVLKMDDRQIHFHLKGFLMGHKIEEVISPENVPVLKDEVYILKLTYLYIEKRKLYVKIDEYKSMSEVRIFF